jgi:hypothetical protein
MVDRYCVPRFATGRILRCGSFVIFYFGRYEIVDSEYHVVNTSLPLTICKSLTASYNTRKESVHGTVANLNKKRGVEGKI